MITKAQRLANYIPRPLESNEQIKARFEREAQEEHWAEIRHTVDSYNEWMDKYKSNEE